MPRLRPGAHALLDVPLSLLLGAAIGRAEADWIWAIGIMFVAGVAVAELLVASLSLRDTAMALGVTRNTARTYLKRIFGTTGVRRRAERMKRIVDTPVRIAIRETEQAWCRRLPVEDG